PFKWILMAVVLGNASIYLLSDTPISARDITRHDRGIDEKPAYPATFKPQTTEIVSGYDAVLAEYYLERLPHGLPPLLSYDPVGNPGFTLPLSCAQAGPRMPCAESDVDVVLWDDLLRAEGSGWQEVRMPHGSRLRIARSEEHTSELQSHLN